MQPPEAHLIDGVCMQTALAQPFEAFASHAQPSAPASDKLQQSPTLPAAYNLRDRARASTLKRVRCSEFDSYAVLGNSDTE